MRALAVAAVLLVFAMPVAAQPVPDRETNPFIGDTKAVEQGRNIFRGRCAVCHGMDAKGYRGTDLTSGEWVHGGSDAQLFRTDRARRAWHGDAGQRQHVGRGSVDGARLHPHARRAGGSARRGAGTRDVASNSSGRATKETAGNATWSAAAAAASAQTCRASARHDPPPRSSDEIRNPSEMIPVGFEDGHRDHARRAQGARHAQERRLVFDSVDDGQRGAAHARSSVTCARSSPIRSR